MPFHVCNAHRRGGTCCTGRAAPWACRWWCCWRAGRTPPSNRSLQVRTGLRWRTVIIYYRTEWTTGRKQGVWLLWTWRVHRGLPISMYLVHLPPPLQHPYFANIACTEPFNFNFPFIFLLSSFPVKNVLLFLFIFYRYLSWTANVPPPTESI